MKRILYAVTLLCAVHAPLCGRAQSSGEITLRLTPSTATQVSQPTPAVVWLQPIGTTLPFTPQGKYTLLQKNRTFYPHLQVVPVGSSVQFPNLDPFFHNVFSLFDGRRFDLGLYEAGSSKAVLFSREGVSYIFCNIHPEMSAVVLALSTPLYTLTKIGQDTQIGSIPSGDYELHLWVEGVPQSELEKLDRKLTVKTGRASLGTIVIPEPEKSPQHTNKFGGAYHPETPNPY